MCLVTQSCLTLCNFMDCSLPGFSVHGDSPGKNTGVGGHTILKRIFPTLESNPGLPHCRWFLYSLSYQGVEIIRFLSNKLNFFSIFLNMLIGVILRSFLLFLTYELCKFMVVLPLLFLDLVFLLWVVYPCS